MRKRDGRSLAIRNPAINSIAERLGRDGAALDRTMPRRRTPPSPAHDEVRQVTGLRLMFGASLALVAIAALVLAAAWIMGSALSRAGHSADRSLREVVIGNDVLSVPANVIRFPSQRRSGDAGRLDVYLRWPDLAGYSEAARDDFSSDAVNPSLLFLTIEPRSMTQDMTGRIGPIYSKFMNGPVLDATGGLKRRSIAGTGGFPGEELWYEADNPYPYAARCMAPETAGGAPYCLRDIHIGRDLAVTYRFHQSLAAEWMAIEKAVRSEIKLWLRQ